MALLIKDGNSASQYLPNAGIDPMYSAVSNGTVTTTFTSATDVIEIPGAAGIVARIRRIEIIGTTIVAANTVAATSTLCRLLRRTTAGTTGTWTALTEAGGTLGRWSDRAGTAAAASVIPAVAGTTAFTVGSGTQMIRQGYVSYPSIAAVTTMNAVPAQCVLTWEFGVGNTAPLYLVGASDFLMINLNGVTPVGALLFNIFWDEAAV